MSEQSEQAQAQAQAARIKELELELELARVRAQAPQAPQVAQAPQVVITQPERTHARIDVAPTMKQAAGATAGAYFGLAAAQLAMGCLLPLGVLAVIIVLIVDPKFLIYVIAFGGVLWILGNLNKFK